MLHVEVRVLELKMNLFYFIVTGWGIERIGWNNSMKIVFE
jgi:hypothetical protein